MSETGPLTLSAADSLTITATPAGGVGPYTYQWKRGNTNVSAANGGTSATLNVASVASGDAGDYTVVIKDSATPTQGTVTSSKVTVTVS